MAATHRYENSRVSIVTALPPQRVEEIAAGLASELRQLRYQGADRGVARFAVNSPLVTRTEFLAFSLDVRREGHRTIAETRILRYSTARGKVLFVPIAPAEMLGYKVYRRFMDLLAGYVRLEDPSSTATIIESEDAGRLPPVQPD